MGRDWTPQEHHSADARLGFSKRKMEVTDIDGNISVLYDPDCETAKRFPNLYFLFRQ